MNLGFVELYLWNFVTDTAVRFVKYFGLCHVLSPSMVGVGCILYLLELLVFYLVSCMEIL